MSHHRLDPRRATIAAATVAGLLGLVVVPAHAQAPTNAAPRIDGPTLLTTDVNKPVKLDAGLSDDGVVRDPDITVTVTGGTLDLADQPGLTITGDKTNAVTAAGPVAALDRALDKSVVTPTGALRARSHCTSQLVMASSRRRPTSTLTSVAVASPTFSSSRSAASRCRPARRSPHSTSDLTVLS